LTFDLESGVRVTCDVGYLCGNFSLPRPLCSWLRPNLRDRQSRGHNKYVKDITQYPIILHWKIWKMKWQIIIM